MKLRSSMFVLALTLWAAPAFAQGCAMCYSSAMGASQKGQKALSRAVMVLLLPPVGIMASILAFAFHYGSSHDEQ
jgi:hypothetical protein